MPNFQNTSDKKPIHYFFEPGTHKINYFVCIPKHIRQTLNALWVPAPIHKGAPSTYTTSQLIFTKVNVLFRALEREGANPSGYDVTLDRVHGKFSLDRNDIKTDGFRHTHVSDGKHAYEVMWLSYPKQKIIYIVSIGHHENFNFSPKFDPVLALAKAQKESSASGFSPLPDLTQDTKTSRNEFKR